MSEDNDIPGAPPPDDFSKTTPNVRLPADDSGQNDWDKTNYNFPKQPAGDDWGKTVTNIKPIDTNQQDYGKTMYPGAQPEWGVTRANVDVSQSGADDFGPAPDKTTPYFSLPEAERAKYQNLPPTPAEQAAQKEKEQAETKGIPGWVWVSAGLFIMFIFAVGVLGFVAWWFWQETSFEVTVKGAPAGSDVLVDDQRWSVTDPDGSLRLTNLKAGRRKISIVHPTYTCETREIVGGDGVMPEPLIAKCRQIEVKPGEDCTNIKLGEFDKAERCYNKALDELPTPFTVEDLVRALNILIINFGSGQSEVPAVRLEALKKGAGYIKQLPPEVVLEIGGHTDNVGNDTSNQTLSEARANAVKATLVRFGVRGEGLQTRGYGKSKPKQGADNNTEEGRFYNRRIEYSIVKK